MRFLILTAILACATGAPTSNMLVAVPAVAGLPVLQSGDLQAAAIDAKVQAEDQARMFKDQARLAADIARDQAEQAIENQKETIEEADTMAKEKSEEQFWNAEDKKWQAIDAVKTIEARLEGEAASNAPAITNSLTIPMISRMNPVLPYTSVVYTPGLIPIAPEIKHNKLLKTSESDEKADESEKKNKMELPKLEGLALAPNPLAEGSWIQAPYAVYQLSEGYLGSPVAPQFILTPAALK